MTHSNESKGPARHDVETWLEDETQTVAFIALEGMNRTEIVHNATMRYEIVRGTGQFCVADVVVDVEANDVIVIPPGTPYQDRSAEGMTMICTTVPPFDASLTEELPVSLFVERGLD